MDFYQKYLKYKNKYNTIKHQHGGSIRRTDNSQGTDNSQIALLARIRAEPIYDSRLRILNDSRIPYSYRDDKAFILELIRIDYQLYTFASPGIIDDEIIKMVSYSLFADIHQQYSARHIIQDPTSPFINMIPQNIRFNLFMSDVGKRVLQYLLSFNPHFLQYMPFNIRNDRELIRRIRGDVDRVYDLGTLQVLPQYETSLPQFKILDYMSDELKNDVDLANENIDFAIRFANSLSQQRKLSPFDYIIEGYKRPEEYLLNILSTSLQTDRDVVSAFVRLNGENYMHITDPTLLNDDYILIGALYYGLSNGIVNPDQSSAREPTDDEVMRIINHSTRTINKLKKCKYIILAGLHSYSRNVRPEDVTNDESRELIMQMRFERLRIEALRNDKDIINLAMELYYRYNPIDVGVFFPQTDMPRFIPISHASDSILDDETFMATLLSIDGRLIHLNVYKKQGRMSYFNNDEMRLVAVRQNGLALKGMQSRNNNIITTAVQQNGLALEGVSNILKNDRVLVTTAVQQNGLALEFASDILKNDRVLVMTAVQQNGLALEFASDILKDDRVLVMTALTCHIPGNLLINAGDGLALRFASDILKNDIDLVMTAVKCNGLALEFASDALKINPAIVAAATANNRDAIRFTNQPLLRRNIMNHEIHATNLRRPRI